MYTVYKLYFHKHVLITKFSNLETEHQGLNGFDPFPQFFNMVFEILLEELIYCNLSPMINLQCTSRVVRTVILLQLW